ncbi:MAG: divalent metal cation transporter [Acidobacteriota bacterium]
MSAGDLQDVQRGLRMANPPDPAELRAEVVELRRLETLPPLRRASGYFRVVGPGYLQSAMTLGGGTATAALFSGALFGYELLWVAPVAMLLGIVMLAAVSHQTLSTGQRPFDAMRRFAGAPLAWAWALGALAASVIWHFPQYALASSMLVDVSEALGLGSPPRFLMGLVVLAWAVLLSMLYASGTWVRAYERILRWMVWGIVLAMALVVLRTGIGDPLDLLRGLVPSIPESRNGVAGTTLILSGLSAAVGINMVFLYPYTLLARGWGRNHRRLARFDLVLGMFVPYVLASGLIVLAAANTLHLDPSYSGQRLQPVEAAQVLGTVIGPTLGRVVFGAGILAMALSSITLQMLCCGFVCAEVFGWKFGGTRYRLATLLPVPGVLGAAFWSDIAVWIAVPTNIVCGLFLPAAYLGFVRLQRSRDYLGQDVPEGLGGRVWWSAMVAISLFLLTFLGWYVVTNGPGYLERFVGAA